jgi:hypothetical protein
MLPRQSLKTCADIMKLVDFVQDRFKRMGHRSLAEKPKMGELQMDWRRSEDLKEEKMITTSLLSIAVRENSLEFDPN